MLKLLLLSALAQISVARDDQRQAVALAPITDWSIHQGEFVCTARRSFGTLESPTTVELRRDEPMSGGFEVAISSKQFELRDGRFQSRMMPGGVAYSPPLPGRLETSNGARWTYWDQDIREAATRTMTAKESDDYYKDNRQIDFWKNVQSLEIDGLFDSDLMLPIGPIAGLNDQLNDCYEELMRAHGLSEADVKENRRPVEITNTKSIFKSLLRLLPAVEVQRIQEQREVYVGFVLFVDSDAKLQGCHLTTVPHYLDLEEKGCSMIARNAKFHFDKGEQHRPALVQTGLLYRKEVGFSVTGD